MKGSKYNNVGKMLKKNNIVLGITLGDPCGIGPEISAKTLYFLQKKNVNIKFIVIGSEKAFKKACLTSNIHSSFNNIKDFISYDGNIAFDNKSSKIGGDISFKSICKAADLFKNKNINAIVTAPISKQSLHLAKHFFDGHTGLLGSLFGIAEPYLLLSNKRFSTLHVTCHKSLLDAISLIKKNRVADVIQIGHDHMVKIGIKKPRIGICGLNPHSSENGIFGDEESKEIIPAINMMKQKGININGPISGDIIFRHAVLGKYDLVIAQYHDQGHIPVKLLYFDQSVNITLGVPFIRTSVDHGTAFDIAYKNKANPVNMLIAIIYAIKMSNNT